MPTRSNSPRAMIENSASPLPEAIAPTDAVEAEITPADRRLHRDLPALGQRQPRQHLACGDAVARIHHHFGDLQPHPLGPHLVLLARNDGAGDLDDIGEAGFCGLEHGDGGALGGRLGRRRRASGEENRQNIPAAIRGASFGERSRARGWSSAFRSRFRSSTDTRRPAGAPSAKTSLRRHPSRPADGLRQRRLDRQRNGWRVRPRGRYAARSRD